MRFTQMTRPTLDQVMANLASLNEIAAELVDAVSDDPEFAEMTRTVLKDHSWQFGFEFQGERPPAGWHAAQEERPDGRRS